MRGGIFHYQLWFQEPQEPLVVSWLNALDNGRQRTKHTLTGINPWDAIVELMREKHKLLIGIPTAEKILLEIGHADPAQPRTMTVKGRNMVTGLPGAIEISSIEVQAADNSQLSRRYLDWSPDEKSPTIGYLLYGIAINAANWLYIGILQKPAPGYVEDLFERDPDKMFSFVRGQTIAEHWKRLDFVRAAIIEAHQGMTIEDFQRTRYGHETICSAEWIIHEMCQFEAERRSEIAALYAEAKKALNPPTDSE